MELVALHKRVIGLDVHQAQITACAIIEEADGTLASLLGPFNVGRMDAYGEVGYAHSKKATRLGWPSYIKWCRLPESNWRPFHYE